MKVLLLTNIPAPYMLEYLKELGKKCELTVLFERAKASDRDKKWDSYKFENFEGKILKGIAFGREMALCFGVLKYLKKNKYDMVIVANPLTPTGIISILKLKRKKIPFCIQSEGGFQGSGKGLKEKFKKYIVGSADFYLSGMGSLEDNYFAMYGGKGKPIYDYPFASTKKEQIKSRPLTKEEKIKIRKELKIDGERVIVSVGQFIPRKGMDVLIKACSNFDKNVKIIIIGGTPTSEYLDLVQKCNVQNIEFLPFMDSDKVLKYISCADLFVLATREDIWGLVINEAMTQGVGVITTNRCNSGKKLITNGENGFIVPIEDYETLRSRIDEVLFDDAKLEYMAKKSLEVIKKHNYVDMANCIYNVLLKEIEEK